MNGVLAAKFTDADMNGKYKLFYEVVEELEELQAENAALKKLVCPECDSRIMDSGYCMMGHWCGKPALATAGGTTRSPAGADRKEGIRK